jgi:hypothetical protein
MKDYITVYKGKKENDRVILSDSDFFQPNREIILIKKEGRIVFRNPTMDNKAKTKKPKKIGRQIVVSLQLDIKEGDYFINNEESNIDQLVINL